MGIRYDVLNMSEVGVMNHEKMASKDTEKQRVEQEKKELGEKICRFTAVVYSDDINIFSVAMRKLFKQRLDEMQTYYNTLCEILENWED